MIAIVEEIKTYPGVWSAKVRMIGDAASPEPATEAGLEHTADPATLRHRVETNAVAHLRQAVGDPCLPVILDVTICERESRALS
ncbi:hypothetical protein ACXDF8_05935 [Mycolicibacterium sp. CBM1]